MKLDIGESFADIQVLLKTLQGEHRPRRSEWILGAVIALFLCGLAVYTFLTIPAAPDLEDKRFFIGTSVFLILFAIVIMVQPLTTFLVTEEGIRKVIPLRGTVWNLSARDLRRISLEFHKSWVLVLRNERDRRYVMPMNLSLREALGRLYPEVAPYKTTAKDIRRWKILATVLIVVIAGVALMLWELSKRGLVAF
jgi:hypothetical protein